jgi:PAS domain S-box-containing protein
MKDDESRPSVLVLDDEPQMLNAVQDCLEDYFEVHVETSALAALAQIDRLPNLSVILSDQRMPGLTGDEFLARARERTDASRVMITGFADVEAVIRAVNLGSIFSYVSKPWSDEQLRTVMLKAVEHCRLQRELQIERAYLRNLMENTPDAIYFLDREQRFLRVNRTQCEFLSVKDPEAAVGVSVLENLTPEEAAEFTAENERIFRTGDAVLDKVRSRAVPGGGRRWFSSTKAPIRNGRGEIAGLVTIRRDVTDRKNAELALAEERASLARRVDERTRDLSAANAQLERARADAEQANRAKSAFLAAMSHEIRTPMNGVIGLVEVLARSPLAEEQADTVTTIRDSALALLRVVDDILDFSKVEAGRLALEEASVPVTELVECVCDSLAPMALSKGVDLRLFIAPGVPEQVSGDSVRLRQILNNLIGNAIKFSSGRPEQPGLVRLRVTWLDTSPPRLEFRVRDNGIGMSDTALASLFAPFTQAEASTTRRFGGTGLGLAICKRLVDLMHGEIRVDSVPDQGSEFTVSVPLPCMEAEATKPDFDIAGVECILIPGPEFDVEDVATYLEQAGACVLRAADRVQARSLATGRHSAVVIQGAWCPGIDTGQVSFAVYVPGMRNLVITRGRRRTSRVVPPNTVTLDGNPIHRAALLRAVAVAAGRASSKAPIRASDPIARSRRAPDVETARANGQLILVVEDDETNRKVIRRQLALLGYAAEVVSSGAEALTVLRRGRCALLLTDLHMPDMDGYALCQNIRREESAQAPLTIIALTATASHSETQRALAAGMNDYLTKPVPLETLEATLARWMPHGGDITPPASAAVATTGASSPVDIGVLERLVGNDPVIVRSVLRDFLEAARSLGAELNAAVDASDLSRVWMLAHKMKSSARAVGALELGDLCDELENAGRSVDVTTFKRRIMRLDSMLNEVDAQIRAYLKA